MSKTPVLLGLGANLGDPPSMFSKAVTALELKGLADARLSPIYTSAGIDAEGLFHNAAVAGTWPHSAIDLLHA